MEKSFHETVIFIKSPALYFSLVQYGNDQKQQNN